MNNSYPYSCIKWVGGKSRLLPKLLPLIPEHKHYIEVFGGAGWLLFAKTQSSTEVLNDLNNDLYNFWTVIKTDYQSFLDSFQYEVIHRSMYDFYKKKYLSGKYLNTIDKAHTLYYLVQAGFGASLPDGGGGGFGRAKKERSRLNLSKIPNTIKVCHDRLSAVTIECKDFREILKFYDTSEAFFYLDPPYYGTKRGNYSVGEFKDSDYEDLARLCENLEGKFLLTINDHPFIRSCFSNFAFIATTVPYSMPKKSKKNHPYNELIITNYSIES